ncbi:hypothetical protein CDAR_48901 [Caerostris darwini]|uniref:Uncharacterized protein n=1 Tax=Caerostris darwini TaxID=1538125 RepID=A0AAV4NKP9_9ARAC|nr:hypothetical protein CDAR_48901 [Caerostris darwini]
MGIGHQRLPLVLFARLFADNGERGKILAHPRKSAIILRSLEKDCHFREDRPKTLHANGKTLIRFRSLRESTLT